jgi:dUTP pyrophosphatase
MQFKLTEAIDPSNSYTMDDFNSEFQSYTGFKQEGEVNMDMFKFPVKFINKSKNQDPEYATDGAAGFDFRADIEEEMVIPGASTGNNIVMVPTGLYFQLPESLELQVRPRSGLAAKNGITVLNSPGTVDSDYRGEVKIILINHSNEPFIINSGDRIAQGVINSVVSKKMVKFTKVNELDGTERNEKGFGSTGVK